MFERKKLKLKVSPDMTPMIDTMFLLLIFFMLSSTIIKTSAINVEVPSAKSSTAQPKQNIIVSITPDGRVFINEKETPLKNLRSEMAQMIKRFKTDTVVIQGDKNINYGTLITVMDEARLAGAKIVSLATKSKKEKEK